MLSAHRLAREHQPQSAKDRARVPREQIRAEREDEDARDDPVRTAPAVRASACARRTGARRPDAPRVHAAVRAEDDAHRARDQHVREKHEREHGPQERRRLLEVLRERLLVRAAGAGRRSATGRARAREGALAHHVHVDNGECCR
jgi:hypothetical protein